MHDIVEHIDDTLHWSYRIIDSQLTWPRSTDGPNTATLIAFRLVVSKIPLAARVTNTQDEET